MKSRSTKIAISILIILISLSCHKESPTESNPIEKIPIVPLNLGNSWIYSGTSYDTLGSIIETFSQHYNVTKDSVISNVRYFLFNGYLSVNTDSGLISIVGFKKEYYFNYPVLLNERFHSLANDYFILSLDTIIQVPAGTFHCIRYECYNGNIRIGTDFISPGNGVIKFITYQSFFSLKDDQRIYSINFLDSFTIK
jgi:hypothetical protein